MNRDQSRLHEGDRVRIRNEVDPALYMGMSTIGNEGVIKHVRLDRFDLPQVYIEWDKNHWTYNGAPDCWTFEDHFDILETMSSDKSSKKDIAALLAQLQDALDANDEESTPAPKKVHARKAQSDKLRGRLQTLIDPSEMLSASQADVEEDEDDDRSEAVTAINDVLQDAEAFIVIAVQRQDHPQSEHGVLIPYAMSYAKNPIAELLTTIHMSGLATQAHQDLVLKTVALMGTVVMSRDPACGFGYPTMTV
jgi:hypothetical protein